MDMEKSSLTFPLPTITSFHNNCSVAPSGNMSIAAANIRVPASIKHATVHKQRRVLPLYSPHGGRGIRETVEEKIRRKTKRKKKKERKSRKRKKKEKK